MPDTGVPTGTPPATGGTPPATGGTPPATGGTPPSSGAGSPPSSGSSGTSSGSGGSGGTSSGSGGGITTQTETRNTLPSGDTGDTLADVSADGTVIDSTFTQIGQDGLGRDVQVDHTGTGHYDHSTVYRTTVAADGTRTQTIIGIDHDQSATSSTTIVTAPDAQTRTSSISFDGATVEQVQLAQTSTDAAGNVTTTTTTFNGDRSQVLGITATTLSPDGLSKTTRVDLDGDGTFDRTTSDVTTTDQNGGQTEDVTVTSASGAVLSEVLTARGTDGVSRDSVTLDGAGHILASDTIGVGPQGGTREDAYTAGIDGTVLGETTTFGHRPDTRRTVLKGVPVLSPSVDGRRASFAPPGWAFPGARSRTLRAARMTTIG